MSTINRETNPKKILLESFAGANFVGSPLAIFIKMYETTDFDFVVVLNDPTNYFALKYKNDPRVKIVERSTQEYYKEFHSCKYLVNNVTFEYGLSKKEEQIYINTWHGTPIKKMGMDIEGSYSEADNITRNFLHSDYIIHSNEYTFDIMSSAYGIKDISQTKHLVWGYPSNDLFTMDINDKSHFEPKMKKAFEEGKKVVLYAPTWRDPLTNFMKNEIIDTIKILNDRTDDNTIVFVKLHNKMVEEMSGDFDTNYLVGNEYDPYINMRFVDTLITDYSSIMFDVLAQKTKLLLVMQDITAYLQQRGVYQNVKKISEFNVSDNAIELANKLNNQETSDTNILAQKYFKYDDGFATQRVIDNIIIPKENIFNEFCQNNEHITANSKKKILIYSGGFLNNGISTAVINLINNSPDDYHFVCFEASVNSEERSAKFAAIKDKVSIVFKVGGIQYPSIKHYEADLLYKDNLINGDDKRIKELFYAEYIRSFGHAIKFDAIIDYTGYNYLFNSILLNVPTIGKRVVHLHNEMEQEFYKKNAAGEYMHQKNLVKNFHNYGKYDHICNLTESIASVNDEFFARKYGFKNSLILSNLINHENVNTLKYNRKSEEFNKTNKFIYIGRLTTEKGVDLLIQAFKELIDVYPDSQLMIVGSGELESILLNLSGKYLGDKIKFTGQLSNPYPLLDQSDTLVLCSKHEGQPMVLLEALALNKKIVASNNVGNKGVLEPLGIEMCERKKYEILDLLKKSIENSDQMKIDFDPVKYDKTVKEQLSEYLSIITRKGV
jgi:CDP-glycerol glycerophosphotransferase